jgi:hypothetical protein
VNTQVKDAEIVLSGIPVFSTHNPHNIQLSPPISPADGHGSEYPSNNFDMGDFALPRGEAMEEFIGMISWLPFSLDTGLPPYFEGPSSTSPHSNSFGAEADIEYHPHINSNLFPHNHNSCLYLIGKACNHDGSPISDSGPTVKRASPSSVPCHEQRASNDWYPFESHAAFDLAHYFFKEDQTPAAKIDQVLDIMVDLLDVHDNEPPFAAHPVQDD